MPFNDHHPCQAAVHKFMKSGTTIQPGGGNTTNREPDPHNSGGDRHQRRNIGSSERPRSFPSYPIDPFAVKVSIPPLVLLAYVLWKQYYREDPRLESARRAEAMHIQYLADLEDQKRATEFASKM